MMSVGIRAATRLDRDDVRRVCLRAFPEGENRLVASLAEDLLDEESQPETIALVAELGGGVVGHIAFSPARANADRNWLGYILAPLCVDPERQRLGIGSRLVERGVELLSSQLVDVLFVYGDPGFYGRFGFSAEAAARYLPPCEPKYPFGWQAMVLREGRLNDQVVELSCVRPLLDPALW